MSELVLTGLDGKNPLGFLAALGTLAAASDAVHGGKLPKLRWELRGSYLPVLENAPAREVLLDVLVSDLVSFRTEPAIQRLKYVKSKGGQAHDLKPPPGFFASYLRGLLESATPRDQRSLGFAAALATDVATDGGGNTKPTALHFTAGQQELLGMVQLLLEGVTREDLDEALFGPWGYSRNLPVLGWDNSESRDYALRASDPAKDKKVGVPGADWLAFRGLPFMKVAPAGDRILTTGCRGEWKTGVFRWPLWETGLSRAVVEALLTSSEVANLKPALEQRGVLIVFDAAIRRSEQGGYGSFTPAEVARRR